MGAAAPPKPTAPPPPPDTVNAQLQALAYARMQRKIRQGSGRKSTFLTAGGPDYGDYSGYGRNSLLGQ